MTAGVTLWRIAVDAPDYLADDLSGKGAETTGGRWNRKGRPVLYTSTSIALACLETVVHLQHRGLPFNRYLVRMTVPAEAWDARDILDVDTLPIGWDALPEGKISLDLGDDWHFGSGSPLLVVPSIIVPEEHDVLVNPAHALAKGITARKIRKWLYDPRMLGRSVG